MEQKEIIVCPSCGANYRRPTNLPPTGAEVKCRKCGTLFVVPGDEESFLFGAFVRSPDGRTLRVTDSADMAQKARSGEVGEADDVSHNGTDWFPVSGFATLREHFASRRKRPTPVTEEQGREPKPTVLLGQGEPASSEHGDRIVTATTPPRDMTTIDRRAAPQSEARPAPAKPSDSLLDAIGAKPEPQPARVTAPKPAAKPAPKKEEKKEEDEEFNKLFVHGDDEPEKKPFKPNLKLVAAIAIIAGIVILVLLLVRSGGTPKATAEREGSETPAPAVEPAPAPSPAPEVRKEEEPAVEPPKSDLVKEQEEAMQREPQKAPPQKTAPVPQKQPAPKKAAGGGAKVFVKKGWALADAGENDGAIDLFLKAVEIDPNNGEAYYGLGYAYQAKGQKTKAKEYFQKALGARLKASDKADIQSILNNL